VNSRRTRRVIIRRWHTLLQKMVARLYPQIHSSPASSGPAATAAAVARAKKRGLKCAAEGPVAKDQTANHVDADPGELARLVGRVNVQAVQQRVSLAGCAKRSAAEG